MVVVLVGIIDRVASMGVDGVEGGCFELDMSSCMNINFMQGNRTTRIAMAVDKIWAVRELGGAILSNRVSTTFFKSAKP
jgi:hypothetical protein